MPAPAPAPDTTLDFRQQHAIETPEHVVLRLEIAGPGSRGLAATVDHAAIVLILYGIAKLFELNAVFSTGWAQAIQVAVGFGVWWGYFIALEIAWRGQTIGKRLTGIRVVRDTGHSISASAAVARNLIRVADLFLPPPYVTGILLVLLHPRAKRLGDLVAGTVVVYDRPEEPAPESAAESTAAPAIVALDGALDAAALSDEEFALLQSFSARLPSLDSDARRRLGATLAARFQGRIPRHGRDDFQFLAELAAAETARRHVAITERRASPGERLAVRQRERWASFEAFTRRPLDSLDPDELLQFAAAYREIAADLARARTYRATSDTVRRLERLVAAGHNALYRDTRRPLHRLWEFLAGECPAAVIEARGYVAVAFLMFAAPAAAGFALIRERPAVAYEIVPDVMLERAEAGRERVAQGQKYVETTSAERPAIASQIITNNVGIALICLVGGVFLGVGSLVLLAVNGLMIGTAAGHFANVGLLGYLLEFITAHGPLELFSIWVAGAAGFLLGRQIVAPGDLTRADALVVHGRIAIRLIGAATVLLIVAGLIEGFISASHQDVRVRVAISATSAGVLAVYLWAGVRYRQRTTRLAESSASG